MTSIENNYHATEIKDIFSALDTNPQGISNEEAILRLQKYGLNEIYQGKRINPLTIFIRQFKNLMILILFFAVLLSLYFNNYLDAAVILFVIFLNSIIGFIQEYKAETAIAALKKLVVQKSRVKREGVVLQVSATEIVAGDILVINEGDKISADARIISAVNAQCSESLLTGESEPVDKKVSILPYQTEVADRHNMLFNGTILVRGHAEAVVVNTGASTILGSIATSLETINETTTHFQLKNSQLVKQMSFLGFLTALVTFAVGFWWQKINLEEILPFTLAALVSSIPESLPIIIIVVLSLSARRMAKRNAIVRTLASTETLGVVNIIITDKTGTLTQNKMTVTKVVLPKNQKDDSKLATIAFYCNNVHKENLIGDPTEVAFYTYALRSKNKKVPILNKLEDFPFDQQIKLRGSLMETSNGYELFVSGAPESILSRSKLSKDKLSEIENTIDKLTDNAIRPIGFGYKKLDTKPQEITKTIFDDLVWVGALGLNDPPRPEARNAILSAKKAGIKVIMATGDHPKTALAIAKQIGMSTAGPVLTPTDLKDMTDQELLEAAKKTTIFARMTPDAKLKIAQALQKAGFTIAMTGDGVNDAPSLKNADIGIAMGKGGTDVAREASDIVLADDNFSTIISAIEEGRTQFRNIRRTSFFLITTNLAESVSLLVFLIIGLPLPLLPKQILWLNLVGSGVTDVALATEGIHEDVLDSPPQSKNQNILDKTIIPSLIILIIVMTLGALLVFYILLPQGEAKARTGVFTILSLMQVVNMYNVRSLKKSVFELGIFSNTNINIATILSVALLLLVIYLPSIAKLFSFEKLEVIELVLLSFASLSVLTFIELQKKFFPQHIREEGRYTPAKY